MNRCQPCFQTLNHLHFSNHGPSPTLFHLFPRLPTEVRFEVWKSFLMTRRRLFTIRLNEAPDTQENHIVGGYSISVEQKPRISPLWSVCRESRQVACEHFRLPLSVGPDSSLKLWLCPERDYLFIPIFEIKTRVFINFVNDLKASDPHGIGLLHIAFNSRCRRSVRYLRGLDPETDRIVSRDAINNFTEGISNLESIWFVHLLPTGARLGVTPSHSTHLGLNRTMPLFTHGIEFDLFKSDPRPIQPSMKNEIVWDDPKDAVQAWLEMEKKLGFHTQNGNDVDLRELTREISHIIAVEATRWSSPYPREEVRSVQTMDDYLQLEQDNLKRKVIDCPVNGRLNWQEPEERKRNLVSAAGFWIFPIGTFDTRIKAGVSQGYQDLTGLHPGLGLFELPQHLEADEIFCARD